MTPRILPACGRYIASLTVAMIGIAVPMASAQPPAPSASASVDDPVAATQKELTSTIISRLEFHRTPLGEVLDKLRKECRPPNHDPNGDWQYVNIFLMMPLDVPAPPPAFIDLTLKDISLLEALRSVAKQAGLEVKVYPWAVTLTPPHVEFTELYHTKEFQVPVDVKFSPIGGSLVPDPNAVLTADNPEQWLESQGVLFRPGATVIYSPATRKMIVRNIPEEIELVALLLAPPVSTPSPSPTPL